MTLEALKQAIAELPDDERTALACWLNQQEMDNWDRQMQKDFAPGGRGTKLVEKVKADIALPTLEHEEQQYEAKLAALTAAIDEGDASGIAAGDVFARVRKTLKVRKPPRSRSRS